MKTYKSFQVMWILVVIFIPIMAFMVYAFFTQIGNNPLPLIMMISFEIVFICILLFFYGLTVEVTDEQIILSFGIGLIKKRIKLEDVDTTRVVRNQWYYGLGIRIIPNGWLYNAHGLGAVELTIKNRKNIIRIGSPESKVLKSEIDKRLMKEG